MSVRAAFLRQAEVCTEMGSPFTARLCRLAAERIEPAGPVGAVVLGWEGDPSGRADALPLRLAGALHGLVLEDRDEGLAAVYPPQHGQVGDDALWEAVAAALAAHPSTVLERLAQPPQTNEVMRTAALAPGFLSVAALTGLPLATFEIGASAGLNSLWDRFAYRFGEARWGPADSPVTIAPDWQGEPPPDAPATVVERAACDRAPVDLGDAAARLRLLSYVWADQTERLARIRAATRLAAGDVVVERADAVAWLEARLKGARPGVARVVFHSIMWQYLDTGTQARAAALIEAAGAQADADRPLAWLRLEGDGAEPGAAITLTLWPGGETRTLGRADFHGRWVRWRGWG